MNSIKKTHPKLEFECFDYKPSIESHILESDFIIGHAGAGTVLETLRHHKPLLIVVNDTLLNNHQQELALEMSNSKYAFMTITKELKQTLKSIDFNDLQPFPAAKPEIFRNFMKDILLKT